MSERRAAILFGCYLLGVVAGIAVIYLPLSAE